jgi:hypothetical protein
MPAPVNIRVYPFIAFYELKYPIIDVFCYK